jgi:hypothetical protein
LASSQTPSFTRPTDQPPPGGIFISYRRADDPHAVGRLVAELRAVFDARVVFRDADTIPAGESFPDYIAAWIRAARVMLVMMGDKWHEAQDATGKNRLRDPNDLVRQEVERAEAEGKLIIPILTQLGVTLKRDDPRLPDSLQFLGDRTARTLRPESDDFRTDVNKLIRDLEHAGVPPRPRRVRRRLIVGILVALLCGSALGAGLWQWWPPVATGDTASKAQGSPLLNIISADDRTRLLGATEASIVRVAGQCQDEEIRALAEEHERDPATLFRIIKERYLK